MLTKLGGVSEYPPDTPPSDRVAAAGYPRRRAKRVWRGWPLGRRPGSSLDPAGEPRIFGEGGKRGRAAAAWIASRIRPLAGAKVGLTVGLTALFAIGWWTIPRYLVGEVHTLPLTALERRLPFVESFVYVYLSICLFMPLGPYLTIDRPALARHAAGFLLLTLLAFLGFVLYPVRLPPLEATPTTLALRLLLEDTRLNNLPSLHAAYTLYSLRYWGELLPEVPGPGARRAVALGVGAWAGLVLVSILLIKQHYLIDVVAGMAMGELAYRIAFRRRSAGEPLGPRALHPSLETRS
jgi:membrane-associated phospholipid phosphatase